jgi:hypothetical protein
MKAIIAAAALFVFISTQPSRPSSVLAAARDALGGAAALERVTTFAVSGSLERRIGGMSTMSSLDFRCVFPDKFVRIEQRTSDMGPLGTSHITEYTGFNNQDPIQDMVAVGLRGPAVIPGRPAPRTAAEIAAERTRVTGLKKHHFVHIALPLFATSFATYPLEFSDAGQVILPSGRADAIDARGPDGFSSRLFVDAVTHLPVQVTWMARPVVVFSTTQRVSVGPRGEVSQQGGTTPPPGDPTAGMPDVEWRLTVSKFKVADGLNWPHRFTTTVDGNRYEDIELGTFKINAKVDLKSFEPRWNPR